MNAYSFIVSIMSVGVALTAPLLLAALGGLISIRAGVLNIGLEGLMLIGAFAACAASAASGNAWLGIVAAGIGGAMGGWIYAFIAVYRRGNQVVVGLGVNILAAGLTGYLLRLYPPAGDIARVVAFGPLVPSARAVPALGPIILAQTAPVLLAFLFVPAVSFLLYRTNWGLAARGCGDDPASVDALGHDVLRIQSQAVIGGAVLAAVGGSVLALCYVNVFTENMTGGRGFLALAAFIFGRWTPLGTLLACFVFAAGDALQYQLQILQFNVPYQAMIALPYVLAILAMVFFAGNVRAPRSVGLAFVPDRSPR
jgi:ABC-type uncharacterized transport system permease subunit